MPLFLSIKMDTLVAFYYCFLLLFYIQWQASKDLKCIKVWTLSWPASSDPSLPHLYLLLASQVEEPTDKDETQVSDPWPLRDARRWTWCQREALQMVAKVHTWLSCRALPDSYQRMRRNALCCCFSLLFLGKGSWFVFGFDSSTWLRLGWSLVLLCGEKTVCSKLGKKYGKEVCKVGCVCHTGLWADPGLSSTWWFDSTPAYGCCGGHLPAWSRALPA